MKRLDENKLQKLKRHMVVSTKVNTGLSTNNNPTTDERPNH
jgi:hypothetical protein